MWLILALIFAVASFNPQPCIIHVKVEDDGITFYTHSDAFHIYFTVNGTKLPLSETRYGIIAGDNLLTINIRNSCMGLVSISIHARRECNVTLSFNKTVRCTVLKNTLNILIGDNWLLRLSVFNRKKGIRRGCIQKAGSNITLALGRASGILRYIKHSKVKIPFLAKNSTSPIRSRNSSSSGTPQISVSSLKHVREAFKYPLIQVALLVTVILIAIYLKEKGFI